MGGIFSSEKNKLEIFPLEFLEEIKFPFQKKSQDKNQQLQTVGTIQNSGLKSRSNHYTQENQLHFIFEMTSKGLIKHIFCLARFFLWGGTCGTP